MKKTMRTKAKMGMLHGSARSTGRIEGEANSCHYIPNWEKMTNKRLKNECCERIDCRRCEVQCAPGREKIKRMNEGRWNI